MSGPKVVRIVTREEIIDLCSGLLARIDAALAEWLKVGQRNESIDSVAIASTRRRRDALAAMIESDRFMDFQKQAPLEEQFLRDDIQRRLVAVAAVKAAQRTKERRGKEASTSLLKRLGELNVPMPTGLANRLSQGDAIALAEGFRLLEKAIPTSDRVAASRSLAANLREGSGSLSFADWLARQPVPPLNPAIQRIYSRLDELQDHPTRPTWLARVADIEVADEVRRNLTLDGLEVETSRALVEYRKRRALILDIRLNMGELAAIEQNPAPVSSDIDSLNTKALEVLLVQTEAKIKTHRESAAAEARRTAILGGLASLGYHVTEGMTLASPKDGRLVLRSTTRPDYGVEVSSAGSERMQLRAVVFDVDGDTADRARDRDAETIWCGEVSELGADLAKAGVGLVIEKSRPVGEVPLKRIALAGTSVAHSADIRAPNQRTQR
jgi:hypothetical protein